MSLFSDYISQEELRAELKEMGMADNPRTIRRWEQQPDGLPYTLLGNRKLYRRESVLAWLQKRERWPNRRRKVA